MMPKGRCNLSPGGGSVLFYIGMFGSQGELRAYDSVLMNSTKEDIFALSQPIV